MLWSFGCVPPSGWHLGFKMSQLLSLLPARDGPHGLLVLTMKQQNGDKEKSPLQKKRKGGGSWCSQPLITDEKGDRTEGICLDLTQTNGMAQVRLGSHSCLISPTCKLFLPLHPHGCIIMIAQLISSLKEFQDIRWKRRNVLYFCFSKVACINTDIYKSFAEDRKLLPVYR